MNERGLERLRFAIVKQAAQDYLSALKAVHRQRSNKYTLSYAERTIAECERLVDLDGTKLMDAIWRGSWDEDYRIK